MCRYNLNTKYDEIKRELETTFSYKYGKGQLS